MPQVYARHHAPKSLRASLALDSKKHYLAYLCPPHLKMGQPGFQCSLFIAIN